MTRMQQHRDTAANWTTANPVLLDGEIGVERDTHKQKIGDGVTAWNALPYSSGAAAAWGAITGTLASQTDLNAALAGKASPADITAAINALLNGAPAALDTLKELADAINDDASFAATVTTALAAKASALTATVTLSAATAPTIGKVNFYNATAGALGPITLPTTTVPFGTPMVLKKSSSDATNNVVSFTGTINGVAASTLTLLLGAQGHNMVSDGAGGWLPIGTNLSLPVLVTYLQSLFDAAGAAAAAAGTAAQKAANLSDLASASTARTNLGLGTAATQATSAFDAAGAASAAQAAAIAASQPLLAGGGAYLATLNYTGSAYPARPSTSAVPAGAARYFGPVQPTSWLAGDTWEPTYLTPRQVIWDSDWYTDVDDVVAARILAYYEKAGNVDILATIIDTIALTGAPSMDAFFRSEGRVMQVGQVDVEWSDLSAGGPYQAGLISAIPHVGASDAGAFPDSTTVYRTALANAVGKVDIISVGYLSALQALLQSPADAISGLTGLQLVTAKVNKLWVMGGTYPSGTENNFSRSTKTIAAASYVVSTWPTTVPITFLGFEVGNPVLSGGNLAALVPPTDPLYAALVAHGSANGRSSWDPMMTMLACIGDEVSAGYTTVTGTNVVNSSTGANTFTPGAGPHKYVVKNQTDATFQAQINALLVLGRQILPPTGLQFCDTNGVAQPVARSSRVLGRFQPTITGTSDVDGAVSIAKAPASGTDGAAVASLTASVGVAYTQATSGNQPTYAANSGGRAAIRFAGNQWLETGSAIATTAGKTVYAKVRWSVLPTSNQTIISDDDGLSTSADRSFHLTGITGSTAQAAAFADSVGFVDTKSGLQVNTWHLLTMRTAASGSVEVFIDAISDGSSPVTGTPNSPTQKLHIGCSKYSGTTATEGLVADVAEVRVYNQFHSQDTINDIALAMA